MTLSISSIPDYDDVQRNGKHPPEKDSSRAPDEWVTMEEAAKRLGVSERTIRTRAQQGKIERKKDGVRVLVRVEVLPETSGEFPANSGSLPEALEAELRTQIADLKADKERLHQTVERHQQAEGEMRRLMLADKAELVELRQRLAIAPPEDKKPEPEIRRPWWQWWRKGKP